MKGEWKSLILFGLTSYWWSFEIDVAEVGITVVNVAAGYVSGVKIARVIVLLYFGNS